MSWADGCRPLFRFKRIPHRRDLVPDAHRKSRKLLNRQFLDAAMAANVAKLFPLSARQYLARLLVECENTCTLGIRFLPANADPVPDLLYGILESRDRRMVLSRDPDFVSCGVEDRTVAISYFQFGYHYREYRVGDFFARKIYRFYAADSGPLNSTAAYLPFGCVHVWCAGRLGKTFLPPHFSVRKARPLCNGHTVGDVRIGESLRAWGKSAILASRSLLDQFVRRNDVTALARQLEDCGSGEQRHYDDQPLVIFLVSG